GTDVESVTRAVGSAGRSRGREPAADPVAPIPRSQGGVRRDPALVVEREALKCALQEPGAVAAWYESVEEAAFTHPSARQVHRAIEAAGLPSAEVSGLAWIDKVLDAAEDDEARRLIRELAVEPVPVELGQDARYAVGVISRLLEHDASRRIDDLRGRLQRTDPVQSPADHERLFADLLALEDYKRSLRQDTLGVMP
ncbi:MAG: DNA primase, partial [Candidatus Nanopelagicales bacterium]